MTLHSIGYNPEGREYIPQAFLDKIAKAMLDNTVSAIIKEYAIDKQLTNHEMTAVSKNNLELRCDLLAGEQIKNYIMTITGADNDGIKDIIVEKYYGNARNFTDYDFFQGQKDGTYQRTYSHSSVKERFDILSYGGKNYLCHTSLGYDFKESVSLVCYVDGIAAETVDLFLVPKEYHARLIECADANYKTLAEEVLKNSVTYKETIDAYKKIDGNCQWLCATAKGHRHIKFGHIKWGRILEKFNRKTNFLMIFCWKNKESITKINCDSKLNGSASEVAIIV